MKKSTSTELQLSETSGASLYGAAIDLADERTVDERTVDERTVDERTDGRTDWAADKRRAVQR